MLPLLQTGFTLEQVENLELSEYRDWQDAIKARRLDERLILIRNLQLSWPSKSGRAGTSAARQVQAMANQQSRLLGIETSMKDNPEEIERQRAIRRKMSEGRRIRRVK